MLWLTLLTSSHRAFAQDVQPATAQNDTWNSTFTLNDDQISRAGLDSVTAENVNIAVRFEQTNWAGSSAGNDTFYTPPANSSTLPPGSLLSVEHYTNTTFYTLPPNTAMSRILFQSETANGTAVPASAYVLWPWMPRTDSETGRLAVVGWAHGTSGTFGECAPSHIRNLWYQYSAPYVLALQGYVVVAPDYAGLGVTHNAHAAASANDLFHSVKAAQDAFPELSSRFVLMGHSQGGQAAWAASERQIRRPVDGHLGTIAGSPVTDVESQLQLLPALAALVATLDAGQRIWLDWIADRFANKEIACGCVSRNYSSFRPQDTYQANGNYYLEYATQRYQIA
ncbi:hypothetical protein CBER1_02230 [Cercospora berteroae]|uniref:Serine aminopeptidase S33 domain-containing protein n=1 Tax=Cercospora berteroae TaxID=357750 RepID=A0A2S6CAZ0_9PEZI|nr:hypothetical protein CBER1_02230 [Cercospora berteroae]